MTAPAANKNKENTPAGKQSATKATPAAVKEDSPEVKTEETPAVRIPTTLSENPILADFCNRYLEVFDEITGYNKEVLAEKDSEWNAAKVLTKARELGSPEKGEPDAEIKKALDTWERLVSEAANARKAVLDATSKKLNITLSAVADRDPATEGPLKEKRKFAIEIGTQLATIAKMTTNEAASAAVDEFLGKNPLPAIGRDQTRTFTSDGASTPKYRVTVTVTKNGETLVEESGFTKAALALTKPSLGYDRGKAPKSEDLRKIWENAGNSAEKTVQSPVNFEDNGLMFTITKK